MTYQVGQWTIAAAFACQRDALSAAGLIASCTDAVVRFAMRDVVGEHGRVDLVVLEATFHDADLIVHVETAMRGLHGITIAPESPNASQIWAVS
jgi:hypothetical protein